MYIYVYISKNKKPRFIGFIDNAAVVSPPKNFPFFRLRWFTIRATCAEKKLGVQSCQLMCLEA